jgi:hypothetical protein
MSAETIAINMLAERLSELEDRMDSLMSNTTIVTPTTSSTGYFGFVTALSKLFNGGRLKRKDWDYHIHFEPCGMIDSNGRDVKLSYTDIASSDWLEVKVEKDIATGSSDRLSLDAMDDGWEEPRCPYESRFLSFTEALAAMVVGKRVSRTTWDSGEWIYVRNGHFWDDQNNTFHLDFDAASATDWYVVKG